MNYKKTYAPNLRSRVGWVKTWIILSENVWESRELIWQLFKRDFLMQYKKSFLGFGWSIISPLIGILGYLFYNFTGVLNPGEVGVPYSVYVLLGMTCFGMVGSFINNISAVLECGRGFINQVNYHHDALLFKQAMLTIANFFITIIPAVIFTLIMGVKLSYGIIFIPFMIIPLFMFCSAIALPLALLGGVSKDLGNITNIGITFLLTITPIIYSPSKISNSILNKIINYNPFTHLVGEMRNVMLYGQVQDTNRYWFFVVIAVSMFLLAWRMFYIAEEKIIEKML